MCCKTCWKLTWRQCGVIILLLRSCYSACGNPGVVLSCVLWIFYVFFCVIHYDPLWHKSCIYRIYIHVSADMNTQIASSIFLPHFSMLLCLVDGFIDLVFVKGLRGPTGMVCVVRKTSADHAVPCCFHHLRANKWKQQRSKSSTFNFWVSKNYWDVLTFLNKRGLDYVRKGSSLLPKLKLSDSS